MANGLLHKQTGKSVSFCGFSAALILFAFGFASKASTASAQARLNSALEQKVWATSDRDLYRLQNEIAREIQINPRSAYAHYLLAHVEVRLFSSDPTELQTLRLASELAEQAIELAPTSDFGYVALADVLDLMGHTTKGISILDDAVKHGVKASWRTYVAKARLLSDQTNSAMVLNLFEKALNEPEAPVSIIAPYIIAILNSDFTGNDLIAKLQSWNKRFPGPQFRQAEAISLADANQFRAAHAIYEEILKDHSDNIEARINNGIIDYMQLNSADRGIAAFKRVLAENHQLEPGISSLVHSHLGAALLRTHHPEEAELNFLQAMHVASEPNAVLDFAVKEYRAQNAFKPLSTMLSHASEELSGNSLSYAMLGETLSEKLGEHKQALRAFKDAIALDPSRSDYFNGMGLTYYRMKHYGEALVLFSAATRVDPNDATAHYNEACAKALLGKADDALASLQEALSLNPQLQTTAKTDHDFDILKSSRRFEELVSAPVSPTPSTSPGDLPEPEFLGH